jgi:hypothetical protein
MQKPELTEPISRLQDALGSRYRIEREIARQLRPLSVFATNPDGAHFMFLEPDHSSEMVVVANWESVLRARMAGGEAK